MENKPDHAQSHEEREAETLVTRIEKQAFQDAARVPEKPKRREHSTTTGKR